MRVVAECSPQRSSVVWFSFPLSSHIEESLLLLVCDLDQFVQEPIWSEFLYLFCESLVFGTGGIACEADEGCAERSFAMRLGIAVPRHF